MQLGAGISLLGSKYREKFLSLNRRLVHHTAHHYTWLYESLPPNWPHIACALSDARQGKQALEKLTITPDAVRDQPRKRGRKLCRELHKSFAGHENTLWMLSLNSQISTSIAKFHVSLG